MRVTLWVVLALLALAGCRGELPEAPASYADFAYAELDINDLQARMRRGELDSRSLVQAYVQRIEALNTRGPGLRAVIELNPAALKEATLRDDERRRGMARGPLHGIPILLKDTINATPMATSAGSLALAEFRPANDAFLVKRLRAAGAVILGKTNMGEWGGFRSLHSQPGWSGRGGQARNPYQLDYSVCGSNAATAAAVAANLAVAAIGTSTNDNLSCPAAENGVVALRASVGLVSRDGIIPFSFSQDSVGVFARSVEDVALLLGTIAGRDPADPATTNAAWNSPPDYAARLRQGALRGARIGVLKDRLTDDPEAAEAMQAALRMLEDAGATVLDARLPNDNQWHEDERTLLLYEMKAGLDRFFAENPVPLRDLADLLAYNRAHADLELALFGQELLEQAQAKGGLGEAEYITARNRARRQAGPEGLDAALKAQALDVLVAPAIGSARIMGQSSASRGFYNAAAVAGYPALTVPIGTNQHGLPLGMVMLGPAWSEARLLAFAYDYEQRTLARIPPAFRTRPNETRQ